MFLLVFFLPGLYHREIRLDSCLKWRLLFQQKALEVACNCTPKRAAARAKVALGGSRPSKLDLPAPVRWTAALLSP